jgi:capsular polysaccharide biosynthesis protein
LPDLRYERIRPPEPIERQPPRSIDSSHPPVFDSLKVHEHLEVFRAELRPARIAGTDPIVVTHDFQAVRESTYDLEQLQANPVLSRRLPIPQRATGPHMLLVNPWCRAYFHWMLDTLPRASILPLDEHPEVPVIVPSPLSSFQRETLDRVGIPDERRRPFAHPHLLVEELWFPSLVGRTGNPPRWVLDWLRSSLVPEPQAEPRRRLYVSRADAATRRVVNEDDVTALLAARGFEVVVPSTMPLDDQLRVFSEAAAIAGPHGAGLVNMFAAQRTTIVEFFEPAYVNGCFYAMADAAGHDYWFLMCKTRGENDLEVDLARLSATLDAAGL